MVQYSQSGGGLLPLRFQEVAMVSWMELLTLLLVLTAVIEITLRVKK